MLGRRNRSLDDSLDPPWFYGRVVKAWYGCIGRCVIVKLKGTVEYSDAENLTANVSSVNQTAQERVRLQEDAETFPTHIYTTVNQTAEKTIRVQKDADVLADITTINQTTKETVRLQKGHSFEMKVRVIGAVFSVMLFLCGVAIIVLHYRPLTF